MFEWVQHWLDGDLAPWRDRVEAEIEKARQRVARLVEPPKIEIIVQQIPENIIPELGVGGYTPGARVLFLALDPGSPHFVESLGNEALQRMVVHEVHHCLRWDGPGYGRTLGEALVSEGLAGRFASILYDSPPEPWECAVAPADAAAHFPDAATLAASDYDHRAWFFGTGGTYPRWLGYTLGYLVAGAWLRSVREVDVERLVNVPAAEVLAAWPKSLPSRAPARDLS